jgi:hypothetical protein
MTQHPKSSAGFIITMTELDTGVSFVLGKYESVTYDMAAGQAPKSIKLELTAWSGCENKEDFKPRAVPSHVL